MARNRELDTAREAAQAKLAAAFTGTRRDYRVAIVQDVDPEDSGRLLVKFDDGDTVSVVAQAGLFPVGAGVSVQMDAAGRPLQVTGQVEDMPAGVDEGVTVGTVTAHPSLVPDFGPQIEAARQELATAQDKLTADLALVDSRTQAALAAALAAGEHVTVSVAQPEHQQEGAVWFVLDADGRVTGVKDYTGGSWVDRSLVADSVLVPGSVGSVVLADGAVTAPKIVASEELEAKLATFRKVTTGQLVAGNATITGNMIVDTLAGKTLVGSTIDGGLIRLQNQQVVDDVSVWSSNWALNTEDPDISFVLATDYSGFTATLAAAQSFRLAHLGLFNLPEMSDQARAEMTFTLEATAPATVYVSYPDSSASVASRNISLLPNKPVTITVDSSGGSVSFDVATESQAVLTLSDASVRHVINKNSGIALQRNPDGRPAITFTDDEGLVSMYLTLDEYGFPVMALNGADGMTAFTPDEIQSWNEAGEKRAVSWPTFVNPPVGRAVRTDLQPLTSTVWKECWIWKTAEDYVSGGMQLVNDEFIVPITGMYRVTARGKFQANTTGRRIVGLYINGAVSETNTASIPTGGTHSAECNALIKLNAGDRVGIGLYQDSGTTLNSPGRELSIQYVTA